MMTKKELEGKAYYIKIKRFFMKYHLLRKIWSLCFKIIDDIYMFEWKRKDKRRRRKLNRNINTYEGIFDIYGIIKERPDINSKYVILNEYYGASHILKRYSHYSKTIQCVIEHGVEIDDVSNYVEYRDNIQKVVLTASQYRAKLLSVNSDKLIIPIGPIIQYAKLVYDDFYLDSIKHNLGKTLLIFPAHSLDYCYNEGHIQDFIKYVKRIKDDYSFNAVLVCLYYLDIRKGLQVRYLQEGWQIVTAGNQNSKDFLDILKTLLHVSDATISQGYTSAIAYSACLHKPTNIFYDDIYAKFSGNDSVEQFHNWEKGVYHELKCLFGTFREHFTKEQEEFANQYWGCGENRTDNEIRVLLSLSDELQKSNARSYQNIVEKEKYKIIFKLVEPTNWYKQIKTKQV